MPDSSPGFSSEFFMPHGHCYLWQPGLLWLEACSNTLIGLSYVAIASTLSYLVFRVREIPFKAMYLAFGVFIITCGVTHFMDVWTIWTPDYWLDGTVRVVTAAASVGTAIALPPLVPKAVALVRGATAAQDRGIALETAVADLRTPLTLILGPVAKLRSSADLTDEQRRDLDVVFRNAQMLLKHVNDLLD
jgi:signal transduction histidine kinase